MKSYVYFSWWWHWKGDISQSFRGKHIIWVRSLKNWRLPTQLIIFPDFWAKILEIACPVNYSYLPPCPLQISKNISPPPPFLPWKLRVNPIEKHANWNFTGKFVIFSRPPPLQGSKISRSLPGGPPFFIRKACKLKFYWKICNFFKAPSLTRVKNFKVPPRGPSFFHQSH